MPIKEILLEEINVEDETFRISEELDSEAMADSLRKIGQLNPVLLLDRRAGKAVLCGFRRVRAMRRLGAKHILAAILSEESCNALRALSFALWDNLSHRQLAPLEKARALSKLRTVGGVPDDDLIETYLPLLGLKPHESVLRTYISLNDISASLRQCLAEGRLAHASAEYLAGMPSEVQNGIASFMGRVRLSASLQKKTLVLLEELSIMGGTRLDAPLDSREIRDILDNPALSPFEKGDRVHAALYRLRYPALSQAVTRFDEGRKLLDLPGSIHVAPDPFFETADLKVHFEASDPKRFRELADAIQKAAHSPELEALYQIV